MSPLPQTSSRSFVDAPRKRGLVSQRLNSTPAKQGSNARSILLRSTVALFLLGLNVQANVVGRWKFDEASGTTALDSSGQGNTAVLTNGPLWITGQVAAACDFDGANDFANGGTKASLNLAGDHSVEAWIRIDGPMTVPGVIARWSQQTAIGLRVDTAGRLLYHYTDTSGSFRSISDPGTLRATPGAWHHVALTVQRSPSQVRFYIDGQLSGTAAWTTQIPVTTGTGYFCIGGLSGSQYFNGAIDELAIHDRVLTEFEIQGAAGAPYPAMASVPRPNPEPGFPSGMDPYFAPPVGTASPVATAPQFAEWIRTANAGDAVLATGDLFSVNTASDEGKDTRFVTFGQNSANHAIVPGAIERLDGNKAVISLDKDLLPAKSLYWIWPKNLQGYGRPIAINSTEAWWVGPNAAKPDQVIAIYGRNLSFQGGTANAWVYVKPASSAGQWAEVTAVNPYRVAFKVPAGLANGVYQVWAHNGQGGSYGWSGPLTLNVSGGVTWNATTFNVTSYGAIADDGLDDTSAINSALSAAAAVPYSTVSFPAGTFLTNANLNIPSKVRLKGAGKSLTTLKGLTTFAGNMLTIPAGSSDIEIRDLTCDTGNTSGGTRTRTNLRLQGVTNLRCENLSLIGQGYNPAATGSAIYDWLASCGGVNTQIFFTNCDLTGGLFNITATQLFIDGCHMFAMNDNNLMEISGSNEASVTNCTWQDFDTSLTYGWGLGRFAIVRNATKGYSWNHYFGNNTVNNAGVRFGNPKGDNFGEIFLYEGGVATYVATPLLTSATTATFSSLTTDVVPGIAAVVIKGKGLGQVRRITAVNLGTGDITVTPAWNVQPDITSNVAFQPAVVHTVIYGNSLDGKADHLPATPSNALAGALIQGCHDFTMDSNTITECRTGFYPYAVGPSPDILTPAFFHLYKDNTLTNVRIALYDRFAGSMTTSLQDESVYALAHDFRHNTITDASDRAMAVFYNTISSSSLYYVSPPLESVLFQGNQITNTPIAYSRDGTSAAQKLGSVLLLKNVANRGTAALTGSFGASSPASLKPALNSNTWTNFQSTYSGTVAPVLEIPYRNLTIQGKAAGAGQAATLKIRNAGTSPMAWTASSDASWLTVAPASGTVPDENSSASLTLAANPSVLAAGAYSATVTVTCGAQSKKADIRFVVGP